MSKERKPCTRDDDAGRAHAEIRLNGVVPCRRCKDVVYCDVKHCCLGNDHILIIEELTSNLSIETDSHTVGFIVEKGGVNSHAVSLVRALQRPAVGNIPEPAATIPVGAQILIRGDTGEVILNPSAQTLKNYQPIGQQKSQEGICY